MACLCHTRGVDCAQGRKCPVRQELVTAGMPLPYLLLQTGCMTGPHRKTRPVTRWSRAARRFTRALLAFLVAPRPYL